MHRRLHIPGKLIQRPVQGLFPLIQQDDFFQSRPLRDLMLRLAQLHHGQLLPVLDVIQRPASADHEEISLQRRSEIVAVAVDDQIHESINGQILRCVQIMDESVDEEC